MKKEVKATKIEVHFPSDKKRKLYGEYLWAIRIGKNKAKIESIPFTRYEVAQGDLVLINKKNEFVKVLERVARTRGLIYGDPNEETLEELSERFVEVCQKLEAHDIYVEGAKPGWCSLSVPNDIDDDELEELVDEVDAMLLKKW